MRKWTLLSYICIFFTICTSLANAQWVQTGPSGGFINKFSVNGDKIYAAAYGGVLISADNGASWTHSNWGLTDGDVQPVDATTKKVFAGTYFRRIIMSDVNGLIWQQTSLNDGTITCFATIGDNVFAGTYSTGVYLSTDNGLTWNKVNNKLGDLQIECLAVMGTNLFAGTSSAVYLSTDMGANWSLASTGLPDNSVISLAVNGTDLYAGVWGGGAYYSPNNGQGWMQLGECPTHYVYSFAFNGSKVYAAGQKVCVTANGGADWTDLSPSNTDGLPSSNIEAICYSGGNLVAGDNMINVSTGIYVSKNEGNSWAQSNAGVPNFCTSGIAANGENIVDATSGGFFFSTDGGAEWNDPTMHGDFRWSDFSAVAFRGSNYVFAGDVNGYVYVSTDGGKELTLQTQIEQGATVTSFAFIGTNVFAATKAYSAGTAGGVFISADNGATWTAVNNGLPTISDTNTVVNSLAVIGNNLFAGTGHGVYLSTNNGTSWKKVNNGLTGITVYSLAAKGTEIFAGTFGQGVFRSNDNGGHWTHTSLIKDVTSMITVDTNLFVGTWSQGVYWLVNMDSSWVQVGLPGNYVTSFASLNGNLYAATINNSVWKRPVSEMTVITGIKKETPSDFSLYQNYPNPFNPTTSIEYSLDKRQFVSLKVYDILGREVAVLINEEKPAGSYEVKFDASGLSSGVYLYRISAGKNSVTRKMILMR